jgi:glycosyltransferase involved in cell wall biosynthesis
MTIEKPPFNSLLFWGLLPPVNINGIAISNRINLTILSKAFQIDKLEEEYSIQNHGKLDFYKFKSIFRSIIRLIKKSRDTRYEYFYLVFSLSTGGAIKTLAIVATFRLFNRGKIVLHIHRGDFFTHFYKSWLNKKIARLIFGLVQKVIILSESQQNEFQAEFNRKFEVLPNSSEIEPENVNFERKNTNFIFVSNYLIDKGIIDLLEVFESLVEIYPDIKLETYGEFPDQFTKDAVLKYNSANIQIHGSITGIDKYKKLAQADCLILPSWNEGQPLVLLEAMSVGTPVIATQVGLIPELLGNGYPYYSIPKDRQSLKETISRFLGSASNFIVSKELNERYNALFSLKKHEERLLQIFD